MTILPAKMEQLEYMGRIVENDADYKFVKKETRLFELKNVRR